VAQAVGGSSTNPSCIVGDDAIVPDVAGWRIENMPDLPETAYFPIAPDWVCEVLSPSTASTDRAVKMPIYAREGVSHLWFIDPIERLIEIYKLTPQRQWLLLGVHANDARIRAEPFAAVELDIARLWSKPVPAK
jgi:Uma2 family endonuclease